MNKHRKEAMHLQNAIQGFIAERMLLPEVVIFAIGEFLINYSVSHRGTVFTEKFLKKLESALHSVQESVALIRTSEAGTE